MWVWASNVTLERESTRPCQGRANQREREKWVKVERTKARQTGKNVTSHFSGIERDAESYFSLPTYMTHDVRSNENVVVSIIRKWDFCFYTFFSSTCRYGLTTFIPSHYMTFLCTACSCTRKRSRAMNVFFQHSKSTWYHIEKKQGYHSYH